ncbi:hypothetical protein EUGRSUZ_F02772 [Eucalyptus grandis]|uniref:Uncharacterized protein n=2 Tax=Eucalyptus grandis TaxID=71139 RepID=A0ACC3KIT8_EUCGR|nr:hypothetical protein EUGRSUZ_F02772 [Eucalyptus grandis]
MTCLTFPTPCRLVITKTKVKPVDLWKPARPTAEGKGITTLRLSLAGHARASGNRSRRAIWRVLIGPSCTSPHGPPFICEASKQCQQFDSGKNLLTQKRRSKDLHRFCDIHRRFITFYFDVVRCFEIA